MAKENVNHPSHYNQHPAGVECIDVIRHYTCDIANAIKYLWRAGLKEDADKTGSEKELEDLKKALWYINDYNSHCVRFKDLLTDYEMTGIFYEMTGYSKDQIFDGFSPKVSMAISPLLDVGIIFQGEIRHVSLWRSNLAMAANCIRQRIEDLGGTIDI